MYGKTLKKENIDQRILRLLGLEDVFDIDYDTYYTLLREALIKVTRGSKKIPTEEVILLQSEIKNIKVKSGRFKPVGKKINRKNISSLKTLTGKKEKEKEKSKIIPSQKLVSSKTTANNKNENNKLQQVKTTKDSSEKKNDQYESISKSLDNIIDILTKDFKFKKKKIESDRKDKEREERKGKEESLENSFLNGIKAISSVAKKIFSPLQGLFDKIVNFVTWVFLGKVFTKLVNWFNDPNNKSKVETLGKLLKAFWPAILAGVLLFTNPFGKFVRWFSRFAITSVARISKFVIPKLLSFIKAHPKAAAAGALFVAGAAIPALFPETVDEQERKIEKAPGSDEDKIKGLEKQKESLNWFQKNVQGMGSEIDEQIENVKTGETKSYAKGGLIGDFKIPEIGINQKPLNIGSEKTFNPLNIGINQKDFGDGIKKYSPLTNTGLPISGAGGDNTLLNASPGYAVLTGKDLSDIKNKYGLEIDKNIKKSNTISGYGGSDSIAVNTNETILSIEDQKKIYDNYGVNIPKYLESRKPKTVKSSNVKVSGGFNTGGIIPTYKTGGLVYNAPKDKSNDLNLDPKVLYSKSFNVLDRLDKFKFDDKSKKSKGGGRGGFFSPIIGGIKQAFSSIRSLIFGGVRSNQTAGNRLSLDNYTLEYIINTAVRRVYEIINRSAKSGAQSATIQVTPGASSPVTIGGGGGGSTGASGGGGGSTGASGGASGGGGKISGTGTSKGASIAKKLMVDLNISPAAAAGIVGNLMLESGLQSDNVENGKGFNDGPINNIPPGTRRVGYGWGQWTNDRLERFRKFLKQRKADNRPATDEDNYAYLINELTTTEKIKGHWKGYNRQYNIPEDDAKKAATWFMMAWERPSKPHEDRRHTYAADVYNQIKGLDKQNILASSGGGSSGGVGQVGDSRQVTPSTSASVSPVAISTTPGGSASTAKTSTSSAGATASKILEGAKSIVGMGRGVGDQCANTTRAALKAAGNPAAKKNTKVGDLDSEGTAYNGFGFAASFGGSDMGKVIRDKSQIKAGDIILWRQDAGGRYKKGAITHVGIAADDGLRHQYDHNRAKGWHYRPHWHSAAGTSWFAGIRLGESGGGGGETKETQQTGGTGAVGQVGDNRPTKTESQTSATPSTVSSEKAPGGVSTCSLETLCQGIVSKSKPMVMEENIIKSPVQSIIENLFSKLFPRKKPKSPENIFSGPTPDYMSMYGSKPSPQQKEKETEYDKMSIEQLRKFLDPTKTAASSPEVFKAAQEARAEAKALGLPREEVERRVLVASVKAKKGLYKATGKGDTITELREMRNRSLERQGRGSEANMMKAFTTKMPGLMTKLFPKGLVFENTGFNIPGATADRKFTALQPGEYVLPKKTVDDVGKFNLDNIVSFTDSNSTAAKIGTKSKSVFEGISPLPTSFDNIDVSSIPFSGAMMGGGSSGGLPYGGSNDEFFSPISDAGLAERQRILDTMGISAFA